MPPATSTDSTATATSREAEQSSLRLFAIIDGYGRKAPERALWRELVNLAIGDTSCLRDGARTVGASTLVLVAYAMYMRANPAGIIDGFSVRALATDCRIGREHAQAALRVLNRVGVFGSTRASRRKPAVYRMNLGGLDWGAVRARAGGMTRASGDRRSPLKGYVRTYRSGFLDMYCPAGRPGAAREASRDERSATPTAERRAGRARRKGSRPWAVCECGNAWPWTPETGGICDRCGADSDRRVFLRDFDGRHRIVATLDAGGRCEVCGENRPDRNGRCPGPVGVVTL